MSQIDNKLTEIVRLCAERQLRVTFTQYGSVKNSIERTIEMGEDIVVIQIGNPASEELPELLDQFIKSLTE